MNIMVVPFWDCCKRLFFQLVACTCKQAWRLGTWLVLNIYYFNDNHMEIVHYA